MQPEQGADTNESLRAIYREIMSSALSLEKSLTIAYLGPEATFTHQAAIRRFGSSLRYSAAEDHHRCLHRSSKRRADYGVVPVENSTEGVVTHTLDMFVDSDLKIVAQIVLPVQHCLLSNCTRADQEALRPSAIAGAMPGWVQNNLPHVEIIETSSNARSAELAAKEKDSAAIAGAPGRREIRTCRCSNTTSRTTPPTPRASWSWAANARRRPARPDQPHVQHCGSSRRALHGALRRFRRYRINMTKIESRPSKRKAWEYFFFVDCDGHQQDLKVARVIEELGKHCVFVKVLGSYPNAE